MAKPKHKSKSTHYTQTKVAYPVFIMVALRIMGPFWYLVSRTSGKIWLSVRSLLTLNISFEWHPFVKSYYWYFYSFTDKWVNRLGWSCQADSEIKNVHSISQTYPCSGPIRPTTSGQASGLKFSVIVVSQHLIMELLMAGYPDFMS